MLADFLSMTPLSSRCFMYPLDSCILQIAFFSIQTFSMRASVLLVFLLLKTTESGCSQGSIDPALWLLNSSTQKLYKLFLFLFIYLFIYFFGFGLGWLHQRYNVGERTSIIVTTTYYSLTSHLLNIGTQLLLLFYCCERPCVIVYKPSFIIFTLPFLRLFLALHYKLGPCSNLTVLWQNSPQIPSVT